MLTSWRVNILGKAPIGTFAKEGNKLYIKERGDIPHKGEWYRPWKCVKVNDKWINDGGYVSSVELGFCRVKILKLRRNCGLYVKEKTLKLDRVPSSRKQKG